MSELIYYFSGAWNQQLKREMNIDQLFSFYHEPKLVIDTIKYKQEHPEYTARIMLDSGAFTHYQVMKKKGHVLTEKDIEEYTDKYIAYLNEWGDYLEVFVGVDSVPDPTNVNPEYIKRTWNNYLYMYGRLRPEIRHKLMPVFHFGEDFNELKKWLEFRHPDGKQVEYIGLAISLEGVTKVRINWANACRKIINESSNPNVKTHAFGVGVKSVLDHIEVTSTDATSYLKRAAFGCISVDDKSICVSDRKENVIGAKHISECSQAFQDAIMERIKARGFTMEELKADSYARGRFNIMDVQEFVEKYKDRGQHTFVSKVSLF